MYPEKSSLSISFHIRRTRPNKRGEVPVCVRITVNGQRARVLGHVGLCHVSVDVTGLDVKNGDTAILDVNPLYLSPLVPKEYV